MLTKQAALTEQERHRLYSRLGEVLGSEEAETMIELLPPGSWADIATNQRVDQLGADIRAEMAELRGELRVEMADLRTDLTVKMANLETKLGDRMSGLETKLGNRMSDADTRLTSVETNLSDRITALEVEMRAMLAVGGMLVAALKI